MSADIRMPLALSLKVRNCSYTKDAGHLLHRAYLPCFCVEVEKKENRKKRVRDMRPAVYVVYFVYSARPCGHLCDPLGTRNPTLRYKPKKAAADCGQVDGYFIDYLRRLI
jgi:hypothetical protein